ncbi:DUF2178 domain-containing protein, partial [Dysosmobacter welbionis]
SPAAAPPSGPFPPPPGRWACSGRSSTGDCSRRRTRTRRRAPPPGTAPPRGGAWPGPPRARWASRTRRPASSPSAPRRSFWGTGGRSQQVLGAEVRAQVPGHPVLAAQPDVLVVGPQHHLLTLLQHLAGSIEPGVEGSFLAAPA